MSEIRHIHLDAVGGMAGDMFVAALLAGGGMRDLAGMSNILRVLAFADSDGSDNGASLVGAPVIAVPSSIGYGVGAGGHAALHGALASCVAGLVVVNIDNGFGAACAAIRMLQRRTNGIAVPERTAPVIGPFDEERLS